MQKTVRSSGCARKLRKSSWSPAQSTALKDLFTKKALEVDKHWGEDCHRGSDGDYSTRVMYGSNVKLGGS
jgi:hypothetical protein